MGPDAAATDAVATRLTLALRHQLRSEFPYMKDLAIDEVIERTISALRNAIHEDMPRRRATQSRISIFSLPGELRNQIYELALLAETNRASSDRSDNSGDSGDHLDDHHVSGSRRDVGPMKQHVKVQRIVNRGPRRSWCAAERAIRTPALLHASRQVRREAGAIYFGLRTFSAAFVPDVAAAGPAPPPERRRARAAAWLRMLGPDQAGLLRAFVVKLVRTTRADLERMVEKGVFGAEIEAEAEAEAEAQVEREGESEDRGGQVLVEAGSAPGKEEEKGRRRRIRRREIMKVLGLADLGVPDAAVRVWYDESTSRKEDCKVWTDLRDDDGEDEEDEEEEEEECRAAA